MCFFHFMHEVFVLGQELQCITEIGVRCFGISIAYCYVLLCLMTKSSVRVKVQANMFLKKLLNVVYFM